MAIASSAQTFNNVANFNETDGAYPQGMTLVQGLDGNLYGTTSEGGDLNCGGAPDGCGVVFMVPQSEGLITAYKFCFRTNCSHGSFPLASLVLAMDGAFYGTTEYGGTNDIGTIFKITAEGKLTTLYNFCAQDGCSERPLTALIQATDGNFYGTALGGTNGLGVVFRMTPSGTVNTIHSFTENEGQAPSGLIEGTDGNFYGTTDEGGDPNCMPSEGCGTAFKVTPSGVLTVLHTFEGNDGSGPISGLVQGTDGNFYGATGFGGHINTCYPPHGCGTVFRFTSKGAFTKLYSFDGTDGGFPEGGLIQATDGNLYGTTSGGPGAVGTIFSVVQGGTLTTLYVFGGDDPFPVGSLLQTTSGVLYGTTADGGTNNCQSGCGTVFSLDMALGPFVTFVHASGKVGQTGGILGQGFTGTTSVSFNGIPTSFTVVSDTYVTATVPAGATTGYVTVITPSGTLTSNVPFHVLK